MDQHTHVLRQLSAMLFAAMLSLPLLADDTIYTKADVNPVPVKTPPPEFPNSMKREKISGVVVVSIVVDETGAVASCTVTKSSHADFEAPALDAIKKWKFKPAQKDGVPVKMKLAVPLRFNIDE